MQNEKTIGRLDHLTFKGNLKRSRYGWLRLTPAYSVHLVSELLDLYGCEDSVVLDPFCGTGTTALVCAEQGIACDTTDINPFLHWLTQVKTSSYSTKDIDAFVEASTRVAKAIDAVGDVPSWTPPIHQIEKWWENDTLSALGRAMSTIGDVAGSLSAKATDLLRIAFCRTMIECASVSFGHQSMSFKKREAVPVTLSLFAVGDTVVSAWQNATAVVRESAGSSIRHQPRVLLCDARMLTTTLDVNRYTCVITSPLYPNRMSYIRELRPYMYWLGYLRDGREAGELDWQAIGGTWGCATSNLTRWTVPTQIDLPFQEFDAILSSIAKHSSLLSRYVQKYFYDMALHCKELFQVVKPGGIVNYIVGNSKFYDVLLPVEHLYAALFEAVGFNNVDIRVIRKRTSKRELFEFVVSARKPG